MADKERKRHVKSIDLNDYLLEKATRLTPSPFSTVSDVVVTALIEFFVRYNIEKEDESVFDIFKKILETPEGKLAFDKVMEEKKKTVILDENDENT